MKLVLSHTESKTNSLRTQLNNYWEGEFLYYETKLQWLRRSRSL